ncbi:putative stress responsive a b barrel domain-containing protein [Diaporthe ampelina]|uniref:Putative stress responsive a b barrel domain-containing protein n=1 Tax=Diaporthe ampelina TaxID=1214573 RepID=A0A0G2HC41_9PEZI|nr:putative stress responsive a b barrel domain-containing protein [Diaporthe ampelina]
MRNAVFSLVALSLTALLALWLIFDPFHPDWTVPAFHFSVTHTVLFQFKKDADPQAIRSACNEMMALRTACVNPSSLELYIKSLTGGKDNSPEGLQHGATHGFVVEFASTQDRDYYVSQDPAHQKLKKSMASLVENVVVVDWENGQF